MTELFQVLTPADALDRLLEGLPTIKETEEIPVQEAMVESWLQTFYRRLNFRPFPAPTWMGMPSAPRIPLGRAMGYRRI